MQYFPTSSGLFKGVLRNMFDTNQLDKINITTNGDYENRDPFRVVNFSSSESWTGIPNPGHGQWIKMELTERFLDVSGYAIGCDFKHFPQSWDFEVSLDGVNWLVVHSIEQSQILNGTEGEIFIIPSEFSRFFRWTNRGCNDHCTNHAFYIQNLDLYGGTILCNNDCITFPHIPCTYCNSTSFHFYVFFLYSFLLFHLSVL